MAADAVLAAFQGFQEVVKKHVATKLLNADNAAIYCAIFQARFMTGEPVVLGPRFMELVASDLRDLRAEGLELPGTTEDRVAGWVHDGYLIRSVVQLRSPSPHPDPRGEGRVGGAGTWALTQTVRSARDRPPEGARYRTSFGWIVTTRNGGTYRRRLNVDPGNVSGRIHRRAYGGKSWRVLTCWRGSAAPRG